MFGFTYLEEKNHNYSLRNFSNRKIDERDFVAYNHMIEKFSQDKIFYNSERFFIILDGVIINKKELIQLYKEDNWTNCVIKLYEEYGDVFFSQFRGSFSGIIKDKHSKRTIVFSDHIGSKILYYIKGKESFFVTSFMPNTYSYMKDNSLHYSMSHEGAYMLLCHGYMLDDMTICDQVKRIFPGHYLVLENDILSDKEFCKFSNKAINLSIRDSVELLDSYFCKACKKEFDKDRECSYEHIANLSGGLDSRMTSLVADELGYKKQLNVTFSQSGYWDELIPRKITEDYCHDWIFKNLDSGRWLLDFEDIINTTGGNVLYYGQAHGNSLFSLLDTSRHGILHTGQLGDVFVGRTYAGEPSNGDFAPYTILDRAYSSKFIGKLSNYKLKFEHDNREIGIIYNRGFNGMNNGIVCIYDKMETYSPFLDIDFIRTSLSLPVIWQNKNSVYNAWIELMHPNFLKYGWESLNGHRINEKRIRLFGRELYKDEWKGLFLDKLLNLIGKKHKLQNNKEKHSMNPISYYINHYPYLNSKLDYYFKENINFIQDVELKNDLMQLYNWGNGTEKTQAITLVATNKMYFA